jgi:hypothetical protein
MGHLTLREALASHQLDAFVREQQDDGAELVTGSELERGLALLVTRGRIRAAKRGLAIKQYDAATEKGKRVRRNRTSCGAQGALTGLG